MDCLCVCVLMVYIYITNLLLHISSLLTYQELTACPSDSNMLYVCALGVQVCLCVLAFTWEHADSVSGCDVIRDREWRGPFSPSFECHVSLPIHTYGKTHIVLLFIAHSEWYCESSLHLHNMHAADSHWKTSDPWKHEARTQAAFCGHSVLECWPSVRHIMYRIAYEVNYKYIIFCISSSPEEAISSSCDFIHVWRLHC